MYAAKVIHILSEPTILDGSLLNIFSKFYKQIINNFYNNIDNNLLNDPIFNENSLICSIYNLSCKVDDKSTLVNKINHYKKLIEKYDILNNI